MHSLINKSDIPDFTAATALLERSTGIAAIRTSIQLNAVRIDPRMNAVGIGSCFFSVFYLEILQPSCEGILSVSYGLLLRRSTAVKRVIVRDSRCKVLGSLWV